MLPDDQPGAPDAPTPCADVASNAPRLAGAPGSLPRCTFLSISTPGPTPPSRVTALLRGWVRHGLRDRLPDGFAGEAAARDEAVAAGVDVDVQVEVPARLRPHRPLIVERRDGACAVGRGPDRRSGRLLRAEARPS
jgi:hypothetical protein